MNKMTGYHKNQHIPNQNFITAYLNEQ